MAVKLKLNGKPFTCVLPAHEAVRKHLDSSGADEIFTAQNISRTLGMASSTICDAAAKLPEYTATIGRSRYLGHPKAIAELRKQVGA